MEPSDSLLQAYLRDINQYPLLNVVRERELSRIIQTSSDPSEVEAAKTEMTLCNLRLVVRYAVDLHKRIQGYNEVNLSVMDLISEGNMGLMRAVELFNADKHQTKFSTYATNAIIRRMKRAAKYSRFIRVPVNHYRHYLKYSALREEYGEEALTDEFLLEHMEITPKMLAMIKEEMGHTKVDGLDMEDALKFIASGDEELTELIHEGDARDYILEMINKLNPKDQEVLFFRIFGNKFVTLDELAKRNGVTRQAIDQRIPKALKRLKHKIRADQRSKHMGIKEDGV